MKNIQESVTSPTSIDNDTQRLRDSVETQNRQIESLLELVADMKASIADHKCKPRPHVVGPRPLLKDVFGQSEAAASAKAIEEARKLRRTVFNQEREIIDLCKRLEDFQESIPHSQTDKDIMALRKGHQGLKNQIEDIKCLLEKHFIASNVKAKAGRDSHNSRRTQISSVGLHKLSTRLSSLSSQQMKNNLKEYTDSSTPFPSLPGYSAIPEYAPPACASDEKPGSFVKPKEYLTPSPIDSLHDNPTVLDSFPHDGSHELENNPYGLKLQVQRHRYLDTETWWHYISKYGVNPFSLGEFRCVMRYT